MKANRPATPAILDGHARIIWNKLSSILEEAGRLEEEDKPAFERYCDLLARYWRAKEDAERMSLSETLRKLEVEFGMTPKARYKMPGKVQSVDILKARFFGAG